MLPRVTFFRGGSRQLRADVTAVKGIECAKGYNKCRRKVTSYMETFQLRALRFVFNFHTTSSELRSTTGGTLLYAEHLNACVTKVFKNLFKSISRVQ